MRNAIGPVGLVKNLGREARLKRDHINVEGILDHIPISDVDSKESGEDLLGLEAPLTLAEKAFIWGFAPEFFEDRGIFYVRNIQLKHGDSIELPVYREVDGQTREELYQREYQIKLASEN